MHANSLLLAGLSGLAIALLPVRSLAMTACGGEGERACCVLERLPSCNPGLFEMPFCAGDCACKSGLSASGTCVRAAPAGGLGQRARCLGERGNKPACDSGLLEAPGCSGDCFCGLGAAPGVKANTSCVRLESIHEPGTGWKPEHKPAKGSLRGYADLHVHLFGHLAHGGGVIAGAPYDPVHGINGALRDDYATNLTLENIDRGWLMPPHCPSYLPHCGKSLFHGDHLAADSGLAMGTQDGANGNFGVPAFSGWPRWTSTVHQQTYYKWLERAWRGGLRLINMLAVTNEAACKSSRRIKGESCENSMASIDAQLAAAWKLEEFIDKESGGKGKGWFRIVTTPKAARAAVLEGKLAVVLGIEVDNLFNCKERGSCTPEHIRAKVAEYHARGVRHVFPIHNFDNAFGGAATWQDPINVGNAVSEGRYWEVENCFGHGYGFWLDSAVEDFMVAGFKTGWKPPRPAPADYVNGNLHQFASCNRHGLREPGHVLLQALMDHGIVIDVDHMSIHSLNQTIEAAARRHHPLVASHVQFFDRHQHKFGGNRGRHERMRTLGQLEAIRKSGGMIAVMLKDDQQDGNRGTKATLAYGKKIADDCRHSTKSWAQSYLYAVDKMKGPVAFGSDFNGVAGHVGPRFGSDACGGSDDSGPERSLQARARNRLKYPFTLEGFGTFEKLVTGQKVFDFNVDGLAQIGLLPDLIADLKRIGVTEKELEPLFRSAEGYIEVWERADKSARGSK